MDAVFGVSMTAATAGLVLVEGRDADGVTIDDVTFDMRADSGEAIAQAVIRIEAAAANDGHRARAIGVTWTAEADAEAAVLLKELAGAGFDDVTPVRMPQATEALARELAAVVGFETTAVCLIEPDAVFALTINTAVGSIQTAANPVIADQEELVDWLGVVFATATRRPEALVVVGSPHLDVALPALQDALDVAVFTPTEVTQPLARGAALVSARRRGDGHRVERTEQPARPGGRGSARRTWRERLRTAPVAVLAGAAASVVGVLAVGLGFLMFPETEPPPAPPHPATVNSEWAPVVPPSALPAQTPASEEAPPPSTDPVEDAQQAARYADQQPENQPPLTPPSVVPEPELGTEEPPPAVEGPQEIHQQVLTEAPGVAPAPLPDEAPVLPPDEGEVGLPLPDEGAPPEPDAPPAP